LEYIPFISESVRGVLPRDMGRHQKAADHRDTMSRDSTSSS
jgi:hypothetical protein